MKISTVLFCCLVIVAMSLPGFLSGMTTQNDSLKQTALLRELLSRYHSQGRFNGVVLVAKNGKKILSEGYGPACLEWNIPNSPDKKYLLASVTKTFTATLIMRLIDQGKLQLETRLSEILPWYRNDVGDRVTIRQLLNHTSGIPNYMNMKVHSMDELSREFGTAAIDKTGFAKKYCSSDLESEPGTKWNYNNSAYFLLALVVEQVTQKPFDVAMKESIFQPLHMNNSGDIQPDPERVVQNLATGYLKSSNVLRHMQYWNMSSAFGAGSLYSTTDDLLKFDQALYSPTFLSENSRSAMFTAGLNGYGCGWELSEIPIGPKSESKKIQSHEGFLWAWHTRIYRIPEDGYFIVILSNTGDSPLGKMFTGITDILYGRDPVFPKPSLLSAVVEKFKISSISEAISYGKSLLRTDQNGWDTPDNELNSFGYQLLQSGAKEEAVMIFRWNTELHPESWNSWDSYGEGLASIGNNQAAVEAFQLSIALNPENKAGVEMIRKLKK
jgi:CubicO group peptidase (beta-lactamase class C family)